MESLSVMFHQKNIIATSRNFIITLLCLLVGIGQVTAQTVPAEVYSVQKIESPEILQIGNQSSPYANVVAFNDLGQVIGTVYNSQGFGTYHSFVWKPYKSADGSDGSSITFLKEVVSPTSPLSPIYSTNSIKASSINNQGIVTGSFDTVSNYGKWACPALWDASDGHSIPLQQPPTTWVFWTGSTDRVNDIGTVVGRGGNPIGYPLAVWKLNYSTNGHVVDASLIRSANGLGNNFGFSGLNNSDYGTGTSTNAFPTWHYVSWKAKNIRNPNGNIIGDEYTELSYPNSTSEYSSGINIKGEIADTAILQASARTGTNDDGYRALLWSSDNTPTLITEGDCVGINNSSSVIGGNHGRSGNLGITKNDSFYFIWDKTKGIRRIIIADSSYEVRSVVAINNLGQILAYAMKDGNYSNTFPVLLTPSNYQQEGVLPSNEIHLLTKDNPNALEHEVDGIVCDNLNGMRSDLLNKIYFQFPPEHKHSNAKVYASVSGTNPGTVTTTVGGLTYYPPSEYNENPTPLTVDDLTKPAVRKVTLTLYIEDPDPADGNKIAYKDIYIARPPVVLVHGINSSPDRWIKFIADIHTKGVRMPFARVNHSDILGLNGNAPVELAALRVRDTLDHVLSDIREGKNLWLEDADANAHIINFPDYVSPQKLRLAIRRADVVAWSYGGVVTRWYIASKGADSPPSVSWYQLPKITDTSAFSTINYSERNDVRKFITMGSMWRGVPFCNESNEARLRSEPAKETDLWNAPFHLPSQIKESIQITGENTLGNISSKLRIGGAILNGSSIEVMAIKSPWINYLLYGTLNNFTNDIAKPFNDDIAYSAIAGDDNNYPILKLIGLSVLNIDLMKWFDRTQSPSWFPYLRLETLDTLSPNNLSDGIVPVWSSMLLGQETTLFVNFDHSEYPDHSECQDFILTKFNDIRMSEKVGSKLNPAWNNIESLSSTNYIWEFNKGHSVPIRQDVIYQNINGVGRIHPRAIQENRPDLLRIEKTETTATIIWTTLLPTTGMVQIYSANLTQISDSPKTTHLNTNHSVTILGLTPNTDYFYTVTNTLPNTPDKPIELKFHEGQPRQLLKFTTKSLDRPVLEFSVDRATYTQSPSLLGCDFIVKNTGNGTATDFQITGIDLKGANGNFGFSTPQKTSINATQSQRVAVTINRNNSLPILTLYMSIRYSYKLADGSSVTGNSLWVRVK
jgi:pimeloyl-ACP methyl ester carboxylesterase